ncbi:MAG TPA: MgtC/SapB family protein [Clostridia bacterium]|nr:MgtC/SapB family protein [Clostridia bacterium]
MDSWYLFGRSLQEMNETTVAFRIALSLGCSAFLGFERVRKRRAAGVRTYILVCVASSVVMMTSQFIAATDLSTDLTRLGAQVISGIGFLGAGTIMMTERHQIKGLTTAAGLWTAACIGIALGSGFYSGGVLLCVTTFFTMSVMSVYQTYITQRLNQLKIFILLDNTVQMDELLQYIGSCNMELVEIESLEEKPLKTVGMICTLKTETKMKHHGMLDLINAYHGVRHAEEI